MLSHHAPTRRLLQNFLTVTRDDRKPCLWVYRKDSSPRAVFKIGAESAEQGYFRGDPFGRSEEQIDKDLNVCYELPFHNLLPRLISPVRLPLNREECRICAKYMGNLFLRSKPMRVAGLLHNQKLTDELDKRLADDLTVRRYGANISLKLKYPVSLDAIRSAIKNKLFEHNVGNELFFRTATMDLSKLPSVLEQAYWTICESPFEPLLQSDAAVALLNRSELQNEKMLFGIGLNRLGTAWFLPISPRHALKASLDYMPGHILTKPDAAAINEFLVRAAFGSVYSATPIAGFADVVTKHIHTMRFFEHMLMIDPKQEVNMMIDQFEHRISWGVLRERTTVSMR